jgi:hypothetical protein
VKFIFKYPIEEKGLQRISIPKDHKILSVANQNGQICIWILVDPSNEKKEFGFRVYETGHAVEGESNLEFLGTVPSKAGFLIFHVFKEE